MNRYFVNRDPGCAAIYMTAAAWFLVALLVEAQVQQAAPPAEADPGGNAVNGKRIYTSHDCNQCHGPDGQGGAGPQLGPNPIPFSAFVRNTRQPSGQMPSYASNVVSDSDLADLYAFLQTLPQASPASEAAPKSEAVPAGNAQNGKRIYTSYGCYQCHGYSAQGGTAGPRLGPNPISFSAFVKYTRQPTGQMPPYTSKVVSDSELADIYAFLQAIPKPPDPKSIPLLNDSTERPQ